MPVLLAILFFSTCSDTDRSETYDYDANRLMCSENCSYGSILVDHAEAIVFLGDIRYSYFDCSNDQYHCIGGLISFSYPKIRKSKETWVINGIEYSFDPTIDYNSKCTDRSDAVAWRISALDTSLGLKHEYFGSDRFGVEELRLTHCERNQETCFEESKPGIYKNCYPRNWLLE